MACQERWSKLKSNIHEAQAKLQQSKQKKQSEFYLSHNVDTVPCSAHSTTVNQRDWVKECDSQ